MVSTRQMTIGNNGSSNESNRNNNSGISEPSRSNDGARSGSAIVSTIAAGSEYSKELSNRKPSTSSASPTTVTTILELPQEVIEKIFGYLTYKNICQLRFVCTRFDRICGHILNTTFLRLQQQLLSRFQEIKSKMPRRESARRNHHLACESDIIETLHMRLTLLQMSLGKHIERKHCCFFPGEILDEVLHILHYIRMTPKLARPYKVTDELFDLSTMAMEYFKEKIEPDLPEIAYFSTDFLDFSATSSKNYLCLDSFAIDMEEPKDVDNPTQDNSNVDDSPKSSTPQSNIVLRKGIKKIKQGMRRYNSQLTILRQDVRSCRQKAVEQQKLISEQQKQLGEQQKQILEYATRMDENDKKNEEISRKFSTLLQELNKCKTELQYWRSKSPATPLFCSSCGSNVLPHAEEFEALVNQDFMGESNLMEPALSSDFVPIATTTNETASSSQSGLLRAGDDVAKPEAASLLSLTAGSNSTKGNKRKLDESAVGINEPKAGGSMSSGSSSSGSSTKTRRVLKGRSNRRNKV